MLTSISNLALIYNNQGQLKEAKELKVQVIKTRKKTLNINYPSTQVYINNLALTLSN